MSGWLALHNGDAVDAAKIPTRSFAKLRPEIIDLCADGCRPVAFFAVPDGVRELAAALPDAADSTRAAARRLFVVLADDAAGVLAVSSARFEPGERAMTFESLTPDVPAFHLFERELFEQSDLVPVGHPWLKPVRRHDVEHPFFQVEGEGIHEVAVGPVHAGVIEPGHFRFMCQGERVDHLEIRLGYQHRGIEALFRGAGLSERTPLAEMIAGDSAVAHALAYVRCVDALSGAPVSEATIRSRSVALELERIAMHLATVGALAGDVAYLTGNAVFAALRTSVINATLGVCGSRFGRGWIRPGEVGRTLDSDSAAALAAVLPTVRGRVELASDVLLNSPGVLSRFQGTGRLDREQADRIGAVGLTARASGLARDARVTHPVSGPGDRRRAALTIDTGDVHARAALRIREIVQSIDLVSESLAAGLPAAPSTVEPSESPRPLAADAFAVSMVEGHRGEVVHCALTDPSGACRFYKVKDPSFNNWFALAVAMRGEEISNFPLCNKSFDLSYAGFDL